MTKTIQVGRHKIGLDYPTYFIADIAANHNGDLECAKDLIYRCAEAGANAAKFQNFRAETIVSDYGFKNFGSQLSHQSSWEKSVIDVYQEASLPLEWTETLKATCDRAGIDYFTAPYDLDLIPILSPYVCAWKVGSGDITWHQSIELMAKDGKPLFIGTGAANMDEVNFAVDVASKHTNDIILMQCNTNYTASTKNFQHIALNVLKTYREKYPWAVLGLSDHTPGHTTVLGAIALGARAIEKHFTDNTNRTGPDHKFSMDPISWSAMVKASRELESALGPIEKKVMPNEVETVKIQRRGIRASSDLKVGEIINKKDIVALRPCEDNCLPPYQEGEIIGKTLKRNLKCGECIRLHDVE